jgi:hypothetical protein
MKYIIKEEQNKKIIQKLLDSIDAEGVIETSKKVGGYFFLKIILKDIPISRTKKIHDIRSHIGLDNSYIFPAEEMIEFDYKSPNRKKGYRYVIFSIKKNFFEVGVYDENNTPIDAFGMDYNNLDDETLDKIIDKIIKNEVLH